jgi:hypothetical protein
MIALVCCQFYPASSRAREPGWAGPGWYVWNKAISAPALRARQDFSTGPYSTKEQCEAALPDAASNGQAIPIFECLYFASEADFERELDEMS